MQKSKSGLSSLLSKDSDLDSLQISITSDKVRAANTHDFVLIDRV
jgi:hypothetical protein